MANGHLPILFAAGEYKIGTRQYHRDNSAKRHKPKTKAWGNERGNGEKSGPAYAGYPRYREAM